MASVIIPWGLILLYLGFRVWSQPRDRDRVSYWQTTVQGLDEDPDVFFGQVFQALKDGLASRDVQLSGMGFGPVKLFETASVLSARPLYLQAKYKHLSYYLYLGQTPTGLFLSSRVYNSFVKGEGDKGVLSYAALKYFQRQTMFQYDASIMFLEGVHAIVLQVLDSYIEEKKLKPLEEYERRPILHAFYASAYPPRPQQVWAVPMSSENNGLSVPAPIPSQAVDSTPHNRVAPRTLPLEPALIPSFDVTDESSTRSELMRAPEGSESDHAKNDALSRAIDERAETSAPLSASAHSPNSVTTPIQSERTLPL